MKRVLTAAVLIPIVIVVLFRAPLWLFTLLVLGVALLAAREYFDIAEKTGFRPMRGWAYVVLCCVFGSIPIEGLWVAHAGGTLISVLNYAMKGIFLASPFLFMVASLRRNTLSQSLADAAISFLLIPYIGLTLFLLVMLRDEVLIGPFYVLTLLLAVWSGDIAAYYTGRAIGKHKLAPRISPGKTWEGAIASVLGSIIVAVLLFRYSVTVIHVLTEMKLLPANTILVIEDVGTRLHSSVLFAVSFAVCVNVAAQLGDLFESAIKRGAGIKDSGTLLPGHGGVLDRIDALLFALPVGFFFYSVLH